MCHNQYDGKAWSFASDDQGLLWEEGHMKERRVNTNQGG